MSLTASIGGELNVLWSGDVLTTGRSRGLFSTMAARGAFHWMCSVLFCSRSISLSLFETLKGGALERGILSTIRPQTIPKTYQKYGWRTFKIKIEKWKLSRQCYADYTDLLEYLILYILFLYNHCTCRCLFFVYGSMTARHVTLLLPWDYLILDRVRGEVNPTLSHREPPSPPHTRKRMHKYVHTCIYT